jgi:hypothetical protein
MDVKNVSLKWQYKVTSLLITSMRSTMEKYLNKMGNDGWELVGTNKDMNGDILVYMKKPYWG